jgi:DNA gyrase subunit A
MKMGEFIIGEKQYLSNYFSVGDNETLTAAVGVNPNNAAKNIIFVTKNGLIKKSKLSEYNMKRNTGALAIKLDSNDEIVSILIMEDERLGIMSRDGQFIMVATAPIKSIGRVTRGIIGMKLSTGDYVVSARVIPQNTTSIFSIASDGYGKSTNINEFNITGTNTKGVKIQKADNMCDFIAITSQADILINSNTTQIRIKYNDIPNLSRGAQGTKLIKLTNNYVIGISSL